MKRAVLGWQPTKIAPCCVSQVLFFLPSVQIYGILLHLWDPINVSAESTLPAVSREQRMFVLRTKLAADRALHEKNYE